MGEGAIVWPTVSIDMGLFRRLSGKRIHLPV